MNDFVIYDHLLKTWIMPMMMPQIIDIGNLSRTSFLSWDFAIWVERRHHVLSIEVNQTPINLLLLYALSSVHVEIWLGIIVYQIICFSLFVSTVDVAVQIGLTYCQLTNFTALSFVHIWNSVQSRFWRTMAIARLLLQFRSIDINQQGVTCRTLYLLLASSWFALTCLKRLLYVFHLLESILFLTWFHTFRLLGLHFYRLDRMSLWKVKWIGLQVVILVFGDRVT